MQAKVIGALVLCVALIGTFFFGRSTGIDAERAKRAESAEAVVTKKAEAEKVIIQEKVVWRDRIQKIREVVVDCQLPPDLISLLRESGVFSRRM